MVLQKQTDIDCFCISANCLDTFVEDILATAQPFEWNLSITTTTLTSGNITIVSLGQSFQCRTRLLRHHELSEAHELGTFVQKLWLRWRWLLSQDGWRNRWSRCAFFALWLDYTCNFKINSNTPANLLTQSRKWSFLPEIVNHSYKNWI